MNHIARKILILTIFLILSSPIVWLVPYYESVYSTLERYYLHGLGVSWVGAYVLANLCSPYFMQGAGNKTDYENSKPFEIVTLYLSVMMITFFALGVIFSGLWCLGWILEFIKIFVYWLVNSLVNSIVEGLFGSAFDRLCCMINLKQTLIAL